MSSLEIFSKDKSIYWRVPLLPKLLRLGRMPGLADIVTPPQDNFISKLHASIELQPDGKLHVLRLPDANNPIYKLEAGKPPATVDELSIDAGDSFQIGNTIFRYSSDKATDPPTAEEPIHTITSETAMNPKEIRDFRFIDANHRVEALADLPQLIISTQHERMLDQKVLETVLKGLPEADVAAIVRLDPQSNESEPRVQVLALKSRESSIQPGRSSDEHRPSRKLVHNAIRYFAPTYHVWQGGEVNYTIAAGMDWALCVPMPDNIAPDLGIYAAGKLRSAFGEDASKKNPRVHGDLKFAQLTADIYAALRRVLELQNQQRSLSRFLPMPIVAQMSKAGGDFDEYLKAQECTITVLFCDLRGSCKFAESGQNDLKLLLSRLSEALGIMTDNIVSRWGVIGDFQGDAAMAFWGWPQGEKQAEKAAEAALHIQRRFTRAGGGMACGIGIAHGPGIAGRLGTPDQYKVGAFGPVVNLASRLEGLTKFFGVSILVDNNVADQLPADLTWVRKRKLAKIRPAGMDTSVEVYELTSPTSESAAADGATYRRYDGALAAFNAGRWTDAVRLLDMIPDDGPAKALQQFIKENGPAAPTGWDGTIVMKSK